MALTAGLDYSSSDFVAVIDAGLQAPPELLTETIERLKAENDIVYENAKKARGNLFKKWTARLFIKLSEFCVV